MTNKKKMEETEKTLKDQDAATEVAEEETAEATEETATQEEAETKETNEEETAEAELTEEGVDGKDPMEAKYLRLMADFQNYKKRTAKEKEDIYAFGTEGLMLKLLTVIDNFERALVLESKDEKYAEGMQMIFKQLTDVLQKAGLEEIKALGEDFDPNFHNAVMMEDNPDYESGKVTDVMQKGYMLNKKVIRPSMVKVNN